MICKHCNTPLILGVNYTESLSKGKHKRCSCCRSVWMKQYYLKNKERINKQNKENYRNKLEYNMWDRAKRRAKEKNLDFNIETSDIHIPDHCPILEHIFVTTTNNPYSPTLDRIDSSKGYVKGNIQVISRKANTIKSDGTPEEVMKVAKFMEKLTN